MITFALTQVSGHYHPQLAKWLAIIGLVVGLIIIISRPREHEARAGLGIVVILAIAALLLAVYFSQ